MTDTRSTGLAIEIDPADRVATSTPATWAVEQLRDALDRRGRATRAVERSDGASPTVVVGGAGPSAVTEGLDFQLGL